MWIAIILIILNILIVGALLFIFRGLDSAPKFQIPKFQIPNDEYLNNPKMSPWEYYASLRHKSWNELSEYEKGRMVLAAHLILDECGTLSTLSELEEFLQSHLPEISKPYSGGNGVLGGFRKWQHCQKKMTVTYILPK